MKKKLKVKPQDNGWGFTREDLAKCKVGLLIRVELLWDDKTPARLRKAFAEASHVLHVIAERQVMLQLAMDGIKPNMRANWFYGWDKDKTITTFPIRQSEGKGQPPSRS